MPLRDLIPLFKFAGSFVVPILYIVSFGSKSWVETHDKQYGLWSWCYRNYTDKNYNQSDACHGISPGESPGYFEAVRVLSCFTLITYIAFFFTFNEKEGCGKDHNPVMVFFSAAVMTSAVIGSMANNYKSDSRWKDSDFNLGWCFWMVVSSGSGCLLMIIVFLKHKSMQHENSLNTLGSHPAVFPARTPSANSPPATEPRQRSVSVCSSTSSSTISSRQPAKRAPISQREGESSGATNAAYSTGTGTRAGGAAFPVLDLPTYDIAPDPSVHLPNSPPPSYEEVVRDGYSSAPPPYLP